MIPGGGGALVKMLILGFTDSKRKKPAIPPVFTAMYNPNKVTRKYENQYCRTQANGVNTTRQVPKNVRPQQISFEFFFDGTGASPPSGLEQFLDDIPVQVKVAHFLRVTSEYNGEIHRPNFLTLIYGTSIVFNCVMSSATVDYTLFNATGIPLRAKVNATFEENQDDFLSLRISLPFSPDLSHVREVEEEDNLTNLTDGVYDDPSYYLQIAKHNKLKNFRRLKTGQRLDFPPLRNNSQ